MQNVFEEAFRTAPDATEDVSASFGTCDIVKSRPETAYHQEYDIISPLLANPSSTNSALAYTTADHRDDSSALFAERTITFNWKRGPLLGAGAFGLVHVAILEPHEKRRMAVNEIVIQETSNRQQILNEITVMRSLQHNNVVELFGIDVQAGRVFFFLELCDGGSLADVLARAKVAEIRIDEDVTAMYTIHILEAIQYIHSEGVVHRDIKPANVMLHSSGAAKLADFGTAKRIDVFQDSHRGLNTPVSSITAPQRDPLSKQHSFKGTPRYMSPEIVKSENRGRERSTDIWSLGCVVRELATGEKPWGNLEDESAILFQIGCIQEHPPLPDPSQISEKGIQFIKRCLTVDPMNRPTAEELQGDPWIMDLRQRYSM